ncbi:IS4 family transposase [Grimontia marina]|uniref:Transposase DDE domain protein n=1 Tax=Grimontia marina TaxID=646534 RepID=A0A128FJT6_9GAMM|nr:IS4 family transposase [Grimontia marina]CZF87053.1 Transposase DDE domain protein [Grimontia marina]
MRDVQILLDTLTNQCPTIHKKRLQSLLLATESVLDGADLTLTKLGRSLNTQTTTKHAIKRIDRLLGKNRLHREKEDIYKWHARLITGANPCPVILVDWSDVREQLRHMTLRASVALDGRALTLYEQAFEYKQYNSPSSHQRFLDKLQDILPQGATPIVISDAGSRNTWFRQVQQKGWFWIGRVRGEVSIKLNRQDWQCNKALYHKAMSKPNDLGRCQLAKRSPLACQAYLVKQSPKGRKALRHARTSSKHTASKLFAKSANDPWLLVTNIPNQTLNAVQITRCVKRLDILLLITLLADLLLWWNGLIANQAKWHFHFQANTIKHRRVLSIPRLGKEVRNHRRYDINEQQYHWAMLEYQTLAHSAGLGKL